MCYAVDDENELVSLIKRITSDEIVFRVIMNGRDWVETTLAKATRKVGVIAGQDHSRSLLVRGFRQRVALIRNRRLLSPNSNHSHHPSGLTFLSSIGEQQFRVTVRAERGCFDISFRDTGND